MVINTLNVSSSGNSFTKKSEPITKKIPWIYGQFIGYMNIQFGELLTN
ncbi:hypothetical protein CM15mP94_1890 [bacterium]|nr:MAG: hypothetical protein CM15mP94_1890 [bacterium]